VQRRKRGARRGLLGDIQPAVRCAPPRVMPAIAAAALVAALDASTAHASNFELFGTGPESISEVSSRVARARDGSASFYNPGGLALGKAYHLDIALAGAVTTLKAQHKRQDLDDPVGASLTVDANVPLQGPLEDRIRVGLALYALPDVLLRLRTREMTAPQFPYYDNRTQRMTVIPALAVRPMDWLGIGVGVNVLAGVAGPVDVREGQSRAIESRIEQEAGTVASLIAGVHVQPWRRLQLGAVYRQRFGVPVRITTTANIAGAPLMVDVSSAEALFDPAAVVLGASFAATDELDLELDLSTHRWSTWSGPLLQIDTTVSALSLSSHPPTGLFQDTYAAKLAAAWRPVRRSSHELGVHLGLGYETSMLRADRQQGRSNFVDGPKLLVGGGISALFPKLVAQALRVSAGVQLHRVADSSQRKIACTRVPCDATTVVGPDTDHPDQAITNPGYPTLQGGGLLYVISIGLGVDL
jgi:hypothetical protein